MQAPLLLALVATALAASQNNNSAASAPVRKPESAELRPGNPTPVPERTQTAD